MRRIVAVSWLALGLAAAACQSDKAPTPSASSAAATTGVAGRVIEVSGTVTVAGKQLAKGDTVTAKDTVDTGADGNVVIELAHNNVSWSLGPNKHMRVDASLAWTQPKAAGSAAEGSAESTSAGRHAERSAAGTVADTDSHQTGNKENPTAPATIVASAEGSAAEGGAEDFAKDDERAAGKEGGAGATAKASTGKTGGLGIKGTGVGGGGKGDGTIGLGGIGTIGKGGGGGGGNGQGNGAGGLRGGGSRVETVKAQEATVSGGLARESIVRIIKRHMNALRFCYERALVKNPSLEGMIAVKFTIDKTGAVSAVSEARNTVGDPEVGACIVSRFKQMQFPAPEGGEVNVTYPLVFTPPQ